MRAFTSIPSRHTMSDHFPPSPVSIAEQMAEAIATCLNDTGRCRIRDMQDRGFNMDDIARHWPEACRLAEQKRPRPQWWG